MRSRSLEAGVLTAHYGRAQYIDPAIEAEGDGDLRSVTGGHCVVSRDALGRLAKRMKSSSLCLPDKEAD